MQRKDIFGNIYTIKTTSNKTVSFEQKLREAKAKEKYKRFQQEQRARQLANIKMSAEKSRQGLQKISSLIKKGYDRATSKRLTSPQEKISGSIYKKE